MDPEFFVNSICSDLPDQVQSVLLFGSATSGDFVEGKSTYDLLVVCHQLEIDELDKLAPTIRKWRSAGQPLPLLFTPLQLAASVDAFAIEFSDMQHARRVLFGTDPIQGLTIDPAHVRIQLERELKGKTLALRDRYALAAGRRRLMFALLTESLSTFLSLFRTALRFYQPEAPNHKLDALRTLTKHIPFDPQPFLTIAELKSHGRTGRHVDLRRLFNQYWQSIEIVTVAVDQFIHSETRGT